MPAAVPASSPACQSAIRRAWPLLAAVLCLAGCAGRPAATHWVVTGEVEGRVPPLLFGQFLERASFGEPGPEAFAGADGRLPEPIVAMMEEMRIPLIRFPSGTDVDYFDWRDLIDGVPGRSGGRPLSRRGTGEIGNRFGIDEYFALRDRLGCRTILVLNLGDALCRRRELDAAVRDAVGLLAYANAPLGAALPAGMPDWPAVRAGNGHPQPFGCEFVEIGNEWKFLDAEVAAATGLAEPEARAAWYLRVLHAYLDAIRAIDPGVRILIDGEPAAAVARTVLSDARLRAEAAGAGIHRYEPGSMRVRFRLGDGPSTAPPPVLGDADWWRACATMPATIADDGTARALTGPQVELLRELGYPLICTEWNWNGWDAGAAPGRFRAQWLPMAKACGTAGFLHGLIRQGDEVALATQSLLLGSRWDITAIRGDPSGREPPRFLPQGRVAALYANHHGGQRVRIVAAEAPPLREQPWIIGKWTSWPQRPPRVAPIDVVATAAPGMLYIHIVQREPERALRFACDLSAWSPTGPAMMHSVAAGPDGGGCASASAPVAVAGGRIDVDLPPRSVRIIAVPCAGSSAP